MIDRDTARADPGVGRSGLDRPTTDRLVRAIRAATAGYGRDVGSSTVADGITVVIIGDPGGPGRQGDHERWPPQPAPTVRVLGPVDVVGVHRDLTPQQQAVVAFLAVVGPSSRASIVDGLWDGRRVSESRFLNLATEVRNRIGRGHLPDALDGRYRLEGVGTDLEQFDAAMAVADDGSADSGAQRAALDGALALVRGVPFSPPSERYWTWLDDLAPLAADLEARIGAATVRLAELCLAAGDDAGARRACERGLLACPFDERVVETLAALYRQSGSEGAASRLVTALQDRVRRLEG